MNGNRDTRDSKQIEADLDQTRARVSETLDALKHKLNPDELASEALNYFRSSGGGEFTSNLGAAIKNNPVPATLVGVGLAWLMMSGRNGSAAHTDLSHSRDYGKLSSATSSDEVTEGLSHASPTGDEGDETTSSVRDKVSGAAHWAHSGVASMADQGRDRSQQLSQGASRMGAAARQQAEHAKSTFERMINEQPLVLGAIGVAVGALLAAGLPKTRAEDEMMGEKRDELMSRAQEKGKEQLDKAQQVAESARDAAKEEAHRQTSSESG
jgi:hypothetical protein